MDLSFVDHQGRTHGLNENLIKRQEVPPEKIERIKELHVELQDLFEEMKDEKDPEKLDHFVSEIERIEFEMQLNWGFKLDSNCHTWWRRAPGCQCPPMDNNDYYGYAKVISGACPLHGKKLND